MDVEREATGFISAHFAFGEFSEQLADLIEQAGIGAGVRTRRAPDGGLIDVDDLVEVFDAFDILMLSGLCARAHQLRGEFVVEDIAHQRGFARAGDASDADEFSERDVDVDALEVVGSCSDDLKNLAVPVAPLLRDLDPSFTREVESSQGLWVRQDLLRRALRDDLPAVLTGGGTEIDDPVRFANGFVIVLNDQYCVAEVTQTLERFKQSHVIARM